MAPKGNSQESGSIWKLIRHGRVFTQVDRKLRNFQRFGRVLTKLPPIYAKFGIQAKCDIGRRNSHIRRIFRQKDREIVPFLQILAIGAKGELQDQTQKGRKMG